MMIQSWNGISQLLGFWAHTIEFINFPSYLGYKRCRDQEGVESKGDSSEKSNLSHLEQKILQIHEILEKLIKNH